MGEISAITFESLYETVRKEKTIEELQKLNPEFYRQVTDYLKTKTEAYKAAKDKNIAETELEKIKTQIVNARKLIKELYERREKKALQLALHKSRLNSADESNLLPEEKMLFDESLIVLDRFRRDILLNLVNAKMPAISGEPPEARVQETKTPVRQQRQAVNGDTEEQEPFSRKIRIKFLLEVPEFMGPGTETLGPFSPGDEASMYSEFAETLIKINAAERI